MLTRRTLLASAAAAVALPAWATDWSAIQAAGHGGEVYFNAWGGDDRTNAFIAWAGEQMAARAALAVKEVRLRDTSEAVARVVAEKTAGRTEGGSVDMIWINGPNFLQLKQAGLLAGPVLDLLPNAPLVDRIGKPATMIDFTIPVDGYAVPWRMAQINFIHDGARLPMPPQSIPAMLDYSKANPGRLTHPNVRNFLGVTFLKQALYELVPDPAVLQAPATDASFAPTVAPLWPWYDALKPTLWRNGKNYPETGPAQRSLMNDGEIDLMISFSTSEAATAIAAGTLPPTTRAYILARGTIGNCSFVAIPANAAHRDAALLLADFLLSPDAQAKAADPRTMGAQTVLDLARLTPAQRAPFDAIPALPGRIDAAGLARPILLEPHPSWMTRLTAAWEQRYV